MSQATKLAGAAGDQDPRIGLRSVAALRKLVERLPALHMREAQWGARRSDSANASCPTYTLFPPTPSFPSGTAGDQDPRIGLRSVAALRKLVERLESLQVRNARG